MFRRTNTTRISEFGFGQPKLSSHFGPLGNRGMKPTKDAGVKVSTLPNGLRVISHDKGQPVSTIGFYCEAGPKFDPTSVAPGISHVLRHSMLGSNMENSAFASDRTLRGHGASYGHGEIRKRHVAWRAEVRRDSITPVMNTFTTAIAAPRFPENDIERFRDTMDAELEEKKYKDMHDYAVTMLEGVAFWKEPLGNPRFVMPEHNDMSTSKRLIEHWASHFQPNRMVLAAVNVDHDQLTAAYLGGSYPHSSEAPHHARAEKVTLTHTDEKLQFRSGAEKDDIQNLTVDSMDPDLKENACVAFGWLASGRDASLKEYAAAAVLHEVLGMNLGDSVAAPCQDPSADGVRSFYKPFASAGLMGYTVKATGDKISAAAIAASKLPAAVDAAQLEAAKARALTRMFVEELDLQRDYVDFIATSTFGVNDFNVALKNVTAADVTKELDSMKSQKPAMYAVGHTIELPSLKTILAA